MDDRDNNKDSDGNVLLDRSGNGADDKARFELTRKVVGRTVSAVRFCSSEEYEDGKTGSTVTFCFDDGHSFMIAVPSGDLELFISMTDEPEPSPSKRLM